MKVSGFSLVRNGVIYGYPFKEAVLSILPLCDEFILNVGISDDETLKEAKSINDSKLKIITREWDMNMRKDGLLLSYETNQALKECTGDWCFYIQADEVLHEKYIPVVKAGMSKYKDSDVEGLRFKYKHFYGSYDYYQDNYRLWYPKEVRVIKNNKDIVSWGDAMGFKHRDATDIKVKDIDAEIYHYGWVRPPETQLLKRINFEKLYHNDSEVEKIQQSLSSYEHLGHLKIFTDAHPQVMQERVKNSKWDFDAKLNEQEADIVRHTKILLHPVTKRIKKLFGKKN